MLQMGEIAVKAIRTRIVIHYVSCDPKKQTRKYPTMPTCLLAACLEVAAETGYRWRCIMETG
jgi:hypothetical protein